MPYNNGVPIRVSSERNVSRKNAKIFAKINKAKTKQNFAKEMSRKYREKAKWENIFAECEIFRNVWCLLVVYKAVFIFCVNPSIGFADKSPFENEPQNFVFFDEFSQIFRWNFAFVFKILYFSRNFCLILIFLAKFSH